MYATYDIFCATYGHLFNNIEVFRDSLYATTNQRTPRLNLSMQNSKRSELNSEGSKIRNFSSLEYVKFMRDTK